MTEKQVEKFDGMPVMFTIKDFKHSIHHATYVGIIHIRHEMITTVRSDKEIKKEHTGFWLDKACKIEDTKFKNFKGLYMPIRIYFDYKNIGNITDMANTREDLIDDTIKEIQECLNEDSGSDCLYANN